METSRFELVEKEEVSSFHFPEGEVLENDEDKKGIKRELDRAISLGNVEHLKVKIFFADDKGEKLVNTTKFPLIVNPVTVFIVAVRLGWDWFLLNVNVLLL